MLMIWWSFGLHRIESYYTLSIEINVGIEVYFLVFFLLKLIAQYRSIIYGTSQDKLAYLREGKFVTCALRAWTPIRLNITYEHIPPTVNHIMGRYSLVSVWRLLIWITVNILYNPASYIELAETIFYDRIHRNNKY
jgi:hypothetical protein